MYIHKGREQVGGKEERGRKVGGRDERGRKVGGREERGRKVGGREERGRERKRHDEHLKPEGSLLLKPFPAERRQVGDEELL